MITHHLKEIEKARLAHAHWFRRAKHLIEGLPVGEEMVPLNPDSCEFGKWYGQMEKQIKNFPQLYELLQNIESYHFEVHSIYFNIYDIYFVQLQRSWFMSQVFDSPKEPSTEQTKAAYMYFDKLMLELDSFEMSLRLLKPEEQEAIFSSLR